jgi:hypothetical protein
MSLFLTLFFIKFFSLLGLIGKDFISLNLSRAGSTFFADRKNFFFCPLLAKK